MFLEWSKNTFVSQETKSSTDFYSPTFTGSYLCPYRYRYSFSILCIEKRNALMVLVYPKLKSFCSKLGYEFQVIDMRWGVRNEATDDHLIVELCMKELRKCQETSAGPNFVVSISV
jgi:hypothetical protein